MALPSLLAVTMATKMSTFPNVTIANAPSSALLGCRAPNQYKALPQFLCSPLTPWRSPTPVLHSLVMNVHRGGLQTTQKKLPQSAAEQPRVPTLSQHLLMSVLVPSMDPTQQTHPRAWGPTPVSSCRPWPCLMPATASTWSGWRCSVTLSWSMPSLHTCSVPTLMLTKDVSATCAARRWDACYFSEPCGSSKVQAVHVCTQ